MDSRLHARKSLALRVVISCPSLGMLSGRTRNVSTGGLFVETGPVVLPRDGAVRLYLHLPGVEADRLCVTDAHVVYNQAGGIGLRFQGLTPELHDALTECLKPGPKQGGVAESQAVVASPTPRSILRGLE